MLAGKADLGAIERGEIGLEALLKLNALLDMQDACADRDAKKAKEES